ncbi:hypothetical protein [Micromonospora humi]|uniref:DUF4352 domain-containing protein n=1 Tax=Micromonospora humi TaxID=745366 RepID=A0A1C5I229_9ACTN|nr:hypothetical protein [Micromonospora humi]SCG52304.1 hypothetical protein GA0070213_104338 [Micromonospora humi]
MSNPQPPSGSQDPNQQPQEPPTEAFPTAPMPPASGSPWAPPAADTQPISGAPQQPTSGAPASGTPQAPTSGTPDPAPPTEAFPPAPPTEAFPPAPPTSGTPYPAPPTEAFPPAPSTAAFPPAPPTSGAPYPPPGSGQPQPGGEYPQAGGYPPPGGSYPQAGSYPPPGGAYPPAGGSYPPPGGEYPQAGGYPPPGGAQPPYPPTSGAPYPPPGQYPPGDAYPAGPYPPPAQPFGPPAKKSNKNVWITIGIVAAVLLLLCCGGGIFAIYSGAKKTQEAIDSLPTPGITYSDPVDAPTTGAPSATPQPGTTDNETFNMPAGDKLIINDDEGTIEITVGNFRTKDAACREFMPGPKNGMFLIADVTAEITKGTGSINPFFFTWKGSDGTEESGIGGAFSGCGKLMTSGNNLPVGSKRSGQLIFDVKDKSGVVEYEHNLRTAGSWKP